MWYNDPPPNGEFSLDKECVVNVGDRNRLKCERARGKRDRQNKGKRNLRFTFQNVVQIVV